MMRRGNKDTEENEELHGELTYVSVAQETPSPSAPQKECDINHYFDFHGLDDHFSKSWKPLRSTALGNDIAGRTEMDGWKEVIVTETAEKKKRGLFKAFSKDAKLNKAIFAIGLETAVRNRVLKRNSQRAIAKSKNDPNEILSVLMSGNQSKVDRLSSTSADFLRGRCFAKLHPVDLEALEVAQNLQPLPYKDLSLRMRDNTISLAHKLNEMNPVRAETMDIAIQPYHTDSNLARAVQSIHVGLTGRDFS
ncbi:hypothetical protein FOZ61_002122 [Perkinsus olseni]|uniref:Uncharacterized protein n=1 Tax=Perkinsus olseni TaxID=32597 RepID=A0A7J6KQE1_PEROL|nr:hypothetical protein FOZ61_002122 [Perkinsus olseni]KAF4649476.1 hypothetical protein FOL46_001777 [Perkinsus olseni]